MRTLILFGMLAIGSATYAQNTFGDIIGTLKDANGKEGIWGATAMTYYGETMYRTQTDIDGRYRISGIPAGTYTVTFIYNQDTMRAVQTVDVAPDGYGDMGTLAFAGGTNNTTTLEKIDVVARIKLEKGGDQVTKLTSKEIKYSVGKFDVKSMVTGISSEVRQTEDGSLVFRGARKGDLIYYIDGVKMNETQNVPSSAIGYMMVYSGAIPAKYGDTNGGVIVVETRSYFDLLREYNSRMSLQGN